MRIPGKPVLLILLIIGGFIVGFIFLLRGCLSKYDERSAQGPIIYVKKGDKSVVVAIVKFEKTQSYSQKGNFISKSVSTTYYLQSNDAVTGKKLIEKKLKHHSDISHYPVEVIGEKDGRIWVFVGEPMAFDAFTLDEIANIKILEDKNSALRGKLPQERRFYVFDHDSGNIIITATDGTLWELDNNTLLMASTEDDGKATTKSLQTKNLEKQIRQNDSLIVQLTREKLQKPLQQFSRKEITPAQHRKIVEGFYDQRTQLYSNRDSLRKIMQVVVRSERQNQDQQRKIESLRSRSGGRFHDTKVNSDTIGGKWFGLFSSQEMETLFDRFQYHAPHAEAARRQLHSSSTLVRYDDLYFDKEKVTALGNDYFLNGGFLISKKTALPFRPSPNSYLVVHKSKIGNDGTLLVSRVNTEGKTFWTFDTQLKDWGDWECDDARLIVIGTDNAELSGHDLNKLISIDISNGKAVKYDYFTDKTLTSAD